MPSRRRPTVLLATLMTLLMLGTLAPAAASAETSTVQGSISSWTTHTITVTADAELTLDLSWASQAADLNLGLKSPSGSWVQWAAANHANRNETITSDVTPGDWIVGIAVPRGSTDYTLSWDLAVTPEPEPAPSASNSSAPSAGQQSGTATGWEAVNVDVTTSGQLRATLRWDTAGADLNLGLRDPAGRWLKWEAAGHAERTEILVNDVTPGVWQLGIAVRSGSSPYTLEWTVGDAPAAPAPSEPAPPAPSAQPSEPVADDQASQSQTSDSRRGWAVEQENHTHRYTRAEALDLARRFDTISALRNSFAGHVEAMREANPDLTLYVYMNGVFAQRQEENAYPQGWYARDRNGNKIKNDWDLWMMDVGHPGWRNERAQTCADFLVESGFDGCFIDNLGWGTLWPASLTAQPIDPRTGQEWTNAQWMRDTTAIADATRNLVSPAPVFGNGLVSGMHSVDGNAPTYQMLDGSDVGLAESWLRPAGQPANRYRPLHAWRADVDLLVRAAQEGHQVAVTTKLWSTATEAERERHHLFALTSFMLGDDGDHLFSFSPRHHQALYSHEWWDVDLGAPQGRYYERGDGVFARDFSAGQVLVNPHDRTIEVPLPGPMTDPHGRTVRSVTLVGHSGVFLTS